MVAPESLSAPKRFIKTYQHYINAGIDLTAGSAGGAACVFVGQPLDTIKVKMQTFPHLYQNSLICFKETLFKEGFRGLYAGTVPALVANIAENSVLFCAYGVCQNAVKFLLRKENVLDLNPLENATAGFFAAFFSSFSLCPTELVKCRLQAMRETSAQDTAGKRPHM
ncbi:Mitochondrial ornithine transporter 1 like protein [Argiope bruennichi]|uniref:Mitochondrial ornithine transporter 1 like protein n=1 Tax=Argiope bruennichi TaxID=94029 RepID=A0A8T0F520_ARGBR|nr:Mitochondrial ornithine transporter 1 like protein [Argiope bruennichi]